MAFKQIRVSPLIDLDAYADNKILFALTEIPLPQKSACLLKNITIVNRTADVDIDMSMLFLNNNDTAIGSRGSTSVSLPWLEARDKVLGFIGTAAMASSVSNDWDNFILHTTRQAADATGDAINRLFNGMILEPESGSRSVYFTAIDNNEAPTFAGVTGVLVNGAVSAGASDTVAVDDVSALLHFKVGDTVVDADDNIVGVIKSLTATSIVFNAVTGEALANNEALFTPHSLEFIFDIEY